MGNTCRRLPCGRRARASCDENIEYYDFDTFTIDPVTGKLHPKVQVQTQALARETPVTNPNTTPDTPRQPPNPHSCRSLKRACAEITARREAANARVPVLLEHDPCEQDAVERKENKKATRELDDEKSEDEAKAVETELPSSSTFVVVSENTGDQDSDNYPESTPCDDRMNSVSDIKVTQKKPIPTKGNTAFEQPRTKSTGHRAELYTYDQLFGPGPIRTSPEADTTPDTPLKTARHSPENTYPPSSSASHFEKQLKVAETQLKAKRLEIQELSARHDQTLGQLEFQKELVTIVKAERDQILLSLQQREADWTSTREQCLKLSEENALLKSFSSALKDKHKTLCHDRFRKEMKLKAQSEVLHQKTLAMAKQEDQMKLKFDQLKKQHAHECTRLRLSLQNQTQTLEELRHNRTLDLSRECQTLRRQWLKAELMQVKHRLEQQTRTTAEHESAALDEAKLQLKDKQSQTMEYPIYHHPSTNTKAQTTQTHVVSTEQRCLELEHQLEEKDQSELKTRNLHIEELKLIRQYYEKSLASTILDYPEAESVEKNTMNDKYLARVEYP